MAGQAEDRALVGAGAPLDPLEPPVDEDLVGEREQPRVGARHVERAVEPVRSPDPPGL
jgi:hypothetical protein